jgi:hypothetical protein
MHAIVHAFVAGYDLASQRRFDQVTHVFDHRALQVT